MSTLKWKSGLDGVNVATCTGCGQELARVWRADHDSQRQMVERPGQPTVTVANYVVAHRMIEREGCPHCRQ